MQLTSKFGQTIEACCHLTPEASCQQAHLKHSRDGADLLQNAIMSPFNSLSLEKVALQAGLGGLKAALRVAFARRIPDNADQDRVAAFMAACAVALMSAAG